MKRLKDLSRSEITVDNGFTDGNIKLSCLMRIADNTQMMASNFIKLQTDLEMYQRWYGNEVERVKSRDKTISSLRGQLTKLKKQITS